MRQTNKKAVTKKRGKKIDQIKSVDCFVRFSGDYLFCPLIVYLLEHMAISFYLVCSLIVNKGMRQYPLACFVPDRMEKIFHVLLLIFGLHRNIHVELLTAKMLKFTHNSQTQFLKRLGNFDCCSFSLINFLC